MTCQHIARKFFRRENGIIVWRCIACNEWGSARSWQEYDGVPASYKYRDAVK
jgi:hypothetical protein